jgi:DNA repair photolyase
MLVGIAKLASEGELREAKRRVEYRSLETRSYFNRCANPKMPFQWTLNPYRGCEYGCVYCYARYTHEFMELRGPGAFETQIFAKQWDPAGFGREFRRLPWGEAVALGTATDPYQPAERRYGLTRKMLEALLAECGRGEGLRLFITTKSDLAGRDAALLAEIRAAGGLVRVGMTITTLYDELARLLEPFAPRPALRLKAVEALAQAGVPVGVQAMPVLPLINDSERSLRNLALAAASAGAISFHAAPVFVKPCSAQVLFPFLEREFPHLAAKYRQRFAQQSHLRGEYPAALALRIQRAQAAAGLPDRGEWGEELALRPPRQMELALG